MKKLKRFVKSIPGVLFTVLMTEVVVGQEKPYNASLFNGVREYSTWSVGVWGGGSAGIAPFGYPYYFNQFDKSSIGLVYGGYIKKQVFHHFGVQADFMRGQVKGAVKPSQTLISQATEFRTDINWSASLSGVFTIGSINWINKKGCILPYVSAGGGIMDFQPRVITADGNVKDVPDGEYVSHRDFYLPLAAGVRINVARHLNVDLAYQVNYMDSKMFDGVWTGSKDKFSFGRLGIEYAIGGKRKQQLAVVNPAALLAMDLRRKNAELARSVAVNADRFKEAITVLEEDIAYMKKDSDGDGVPDYLDKCPNTPPNTRVDGAGCPLPAPVQVVKEKIIVTDEDRKVVKDAINNLEFDLGKATIRAVSFPSLDKVAALLMEKNFSLKLAGHTDNTGSATTNMRLSKQRAEKIKAYLVSKGANAARIEAVGYGSTQPVASNKTAEGRQQNRRVEFTLY